MTAVTTKGSWFNDPHTASGIVGKPAISLSDPNVAGGINLGPGIGQQSLKGWFLVKDPGGALHIFQQIDLGPAGFTGRGIDYTQEALSHLKGGDPTNQNSQLVYLGMSNADISKNLNSALQQIGAQAVKDPGLYADAATQVGYADLNKVASMKGIGAGGGAIPGLGGLPALPGVSIPNPLGGIDAVGAFFSWLTSPKTWLRLLELIGGAVAIYFALKGLTGSPGVTEVAARMRP